MALAGLSPILTGCQSTDAKRIEAAAQTKGQVAAKVSLPQLPDRCRQHMERVIPKIEEKPRWTQKRWEFSANNIDQQINDCSTFYDDVKDGLSGAAE